MAGFLADLAKTCVERVINGAITESRYLCCFTCIAKEFEEEKAKLKAERETMAQRFDVATRRDKDIQGNALNWAEQVDKLLQEDTTAKQTCLFGFCPNCMWRYKRGKELANKTEEIKRQVEKGEKLENVELPRCLPGVEYYSSQDYISFKSRELKYKELLDALKDDTNYITGLQGMGGTGKTTLAKEVGKELKQSEQFARVIDTTVSFTPDIKKIQDDIAGPLGLKWEDCNESDRPKKLWSRLTNGEKILLILDDVWGHIDFRQIGIPHSDDHKGCRVLVTTRDLQVCNKMGCEKPIQLDLLSKEDAWIMFKRHARISDSSSKSLLEKGRKIADECKGLPIAIAAIASSLKGQQRREEWDVALKSLQKPLVSMHDVGDGNLVQICKCLKFSYDYLKDEKAKGLFLLCSVFREDEEISTETLTRLGIGSGLFGEDYDKYDDARLEVIVAKNKLLDSCLLLKGNGGCVKMHDLVRDAAHWIAKKEIQTINLSNINQKSLVERENNIKYLLCEGKVMDVTSCRIDGSKLEILIVFFTRDVDHHVVELPNSFFENKAGLRVLHLSNNYWFDPLALSLPQSFQSLVNIRSLLVRGMILGDISILGNLQSLETLDLLYCTIDELPREITTLENFRLLKLKWCEIRRDNPFEVIKRCSSLEELYIQGSFERLCGEITFPMLQRYHVIKTWEHKVDKVDNSRLKCVSFEGNEKEDSFYFSEATFKYWMRTAEFLRLRRIHRGWPWRNLIPDIVPIDQGMNELIELHLGSISQLQCLIDTKHIIDSRSQSVFCNLVVLELDGIENLEELCNGPLSFDSLKSLKQLVIRNCIHLRSLFECKLNLCNLRRLKLQECPMLVSLFQLSTSRSLVMLEELDITDCKQLKHIIVDERREEEPGEEKVDGDNDHKSHGSMFHKLKFLKIQGCPQLEFIFGQLQDVELGSLKELILGELPNFIDIFSECYHPMASLVKESSSRDGSMEKIQLDPIKHNIFSWTHICCYGHKHRHKLRSTTTAKIPLVSKDQLQDCSTRTTTLVIKPLTFIFLLSFDNFSLSF